MTETTRDIIERYAATGGFLLASEAPCFRTLDGSDVAAWLVEAGYTVTGYRDTGRNGQAETACGLVVSTNGYITKRNRS